MMNAHDLRADQSTIATGPGFSDQKSTPKQHTTTFSPSDAVFNSSFIADDSDRSSSLNHAEAATDACDPDDDKQSRPIVEEDRGQSNIEIKNSAPGYLQFPGAFNADGQKVSIKDVFGRPEQDILPLENEPLWKQMLTYCQRWGLWVSEVNNDKRRAELMDFVTTRMREAWEIAIINGHCGEPNGHNSCCLAHDSSSRKHGKDSFQPKESRKKIVDTSRQPVPFASENGKNLYSILNRELDKEGITLDTVLQRVEPEQMEVGKALLKEICDRLGRPSIEVHDWTRVKAGKFNPLMHSRNILMFCLWEHQRCMGILKTFEHQLPKATTEHQRNNIQKRIEIYQQRADQHLALALELDERRSDESDEETDAAAETSRKENTFRRKSTCSKNPVYSAEIQHEDDSEHFNATSNIESGGRAFAQPVCELSHNLSRHSHAIQDQVAGSDTEFLISMLEDRGGQATSHEVVPTQHEQTLRSREKRDSSELDAMMEPDRKKPKLEAETSNTEVVDSVENTEEQAKLHTSSPLTFLLSSLSSSPIDVQYPLDRRQDMGIEPSFQSPPPGFSQHFSPDLQQHTRNSVGTKSTNPNHDDAQVSRQRKQDYTTQIWQPRINLLLAKKGMPAMRWRLRGWSDVRKVLKELGSDLHERNRELGEFKSGFAQWERTLLRQQAKGAHGPLPGSSKQQVLLRIPKLQLESTNTKSNPTLLSVDVLNSSRGFSFRYFTHATPSERNNVDDRVGEYIDFVLRAHVARYGWYVVFAMIGDPSHKPIAHGVWNLRGHQHAEDLEWFYKNEAMPADFRASQQKIAHDWGYSIAPSPRSKKRSRAQVVDKHNYDEDGIGYSSADDIDSDLLTPTRPETTRGRGYEGMKTRNGHSYTPARVTKNNTKEQRPRARAAPAGRRRQGMGDDSENDDDYHPDSD